MSCGRKPFWKCTISVINLENESERQKKKSLLPYGHWWGKLSAHYSLTFFLQGSLESNYKYLVYKYKSYKVRHYFWPDVFRMRLRTPVFYQTIKSLTADQCNVVQNSRDHYHKFGKTQMLVFGFFYVLGEFKKKTQHKYICLSCAWFYPKLVFFLY